MNTCENHSDQQATHVVSMPSAVKVITESSAGIVSVDYRQDVYLCSSCAERIKNIGFSIKSIEGL